MGRASSGLEFLVNSGSGRVGSLHSWVGLGRVKKIGPTFNTESEIHLSSLLILPVLLYGSETSH